MASLREFTVPSARPLPVVLLADVSGSMGIDGKIAALNTAVAEMVASFAEEENGAAEVHLAVVTFGGTAALHVPLTPASDVLWTPMEAKGRTPLGAALEIATDLIEDRERVPSRAYRPSMVLVSDGLPNDEWEGPLHRMLTSERSAKAERFALGVGADADREMLRRFLDDPAGRVFEAHEGGEIQRFFRWVTMSVTSRSRSGEPNLTVDVAPPDLDDFGEF